MDSDQNKKVDSPQKIYSSKKSKKSTNASSACSQKVRKKSNPVSGLSLKRYRVAGM